MRIPTAGDGADEADSVVTTGIEDAAGYRVSTSSGAASVTVLDDDIALFAELAGGETLWTSTLTPVDIGGALLGHLGSGNALSPNGWSEDGVQFRVEQLTYFAQYSELAFQVTVSVDAGSGYGVDPDASDAGVDVYDNDEATSTAVETLWTSTLTPEDIGGALLGYLGSGNALSPNGWSEDGVQFRVEQLTYFAQYSELAFQVSSAPSQAGELRLHLDDLELERTTCMGGGSSTGRTTPAGRRGRRWRYVWSGGRGPAFRRTPRCGRCRCRGPRSAPPSTPIPWSTRRVWPPTWRSRR